MNRVNQGFSLIELMIAVTVVAILSAIAVPLYTEQVDKGRRTDAKSYLLELASAQEAFFAQNLSYANSITDAAQLNYQATSPEGYYNITLNVQPAGCAAGATPCRTFALTATSNLGDAKCSALTLNSAGVKGWQGTATTVQECWR